MKQQMLESRLKSLEDEFFSALVHLICFKVSCGPAGNQQEWKKAEEHLTKIKEIFGDV